MSEFQAKTVRVDCEINLAWIRNHPDLFEPTVRRFIQNYQGANFYVKNIDEHRIVITAIFS